MKILIVQDFAGWAIGKLSDVIVRHNKHLNIKIISIPPKELRADYDGKMAFFEQTVKDFNPDIIHFQYWDIANTLSKSKECNGKKLILTHHNQKNLLSYDWKKFDIIVCHTEKSKKILEGAGYWNVEVIQHGIDIEKFKYLENYDLNNKTLGYVGRIVPWKNPVDVLRVAKEINSEVIMMGRIDKGDVWNQCLEYSDYMDIRFQTPDDKQVEVYHEMGIYIGNSSDNIEEGTLGFLEAMSCGIPVVTTPSGEAMDIIKDGENGILVEFDNPESLKNGIQRMINSDRNKIREAAWNTVRNMNEQVMARKYEKLYYKAFYNNDLVSVIIPTCKREDNIKKVLDAYKNQTYKPIEIIVVVDDKKSNGNYDVVIDKWIKDNEDMPLKILFTEYTGYGLAMARNMGIFEATGHYLIFNDDRFIPNEHAVSAFVGRIKQNKNRCCVWGDKGGGKRDFIENFFIVRKKDIVNAGMFNERINEYGGQSQELRDRLNSQDFYLIFEPAAKAVASFGTHSRSEKKYELLRMKTKLWKLRN